jgi:hypothetical protein
MTYEIIEVRRQITSALEEAIYDVLGGPVKAAAALGVTKQAVHYLLNQGSVRSLDAAERIEEATKKAGRLVPRAELMNLVPWHGPDRHAEDNGGPSGGKGKRRAAMRPRPNTMPASNAHAAGSPAVALAQAAA